MTNLTSQLPLTQTDGHPELRAQNEYAAATKRGLHFTARKRWWYYLDLTTGTIIAIDSHGIRPAIETDYKRGGMLGWLSDVAVIDAGLPGREN